MRGASLAFIALGIAAASALAQTTPGVAVSPHADANPSCVDVRVNGHPALSYSCLNQHLAAASGEGNAPALQWDAVTREPSNRQVGQFNFSALSNRMGNALGHSTVPQRPPPAAPLPLLGVPVPTH